MNLIITLLLWSQINVPSCPNSTAINYDAVSNVFSCSTDDPTKPIMHVEPVTKDVYTCQPGTKLQEKGWGVTVKECKNDGTCIAEEMWYDVHNGKVEVPSGEPIGTYRCVKREAEYAPRGVETQDSIDWVCGNGKLDCLAGKPRPKKPRSKKPPPRYHYLPDGTIISNHWPPTGTALTGTPIAGAMFDCREKNNDKICYSVPSVHYISKPREQIFSKQYENWCWWDGNGPQTTCTPVCDAQLPCVPAPPLPKGLR